jgi:hypothetical protein
MADLTCETAHSDDKSRPNGPVYAAGPLWFIARLFTIGFIHPSFWKAVSGGVIVWPYYLGNALAPLCGLPH